MAAHTRIAVVVVTYNSASLLPALIESLDSGLAGTDWHLVVVDNGSSDDIGECVARHAPEARLVRRQSNDGYAAGINTGVAAAGDSDAFLILNPDVRLGPGCARTLYDAAVVGDAGIAVPRLVDGAGELILTIRREPTLVRVWADALIGAERAGRHGTLGEVVSDPCAYEGRQAIDWAEGSTILMTAECWRRCGLWDESFFLYSEETEYALRARDRGLVVLFVPEASAVHLEGDSAASPGLWALVVTNRLRLYSRRHGLASAVAFWAALVVRESSRSLLGKRTSRRALRTLLSPAGLRRTPGPDMVR